MSPSPRDYSLDPPSIIIDDSDLTIRYSGTWHAANETEIQSTVFWERMPYFSTLHVLQVFSGSFSYIFTGGGISVFATPYDDSSYTPQCFLDGNQLPVDPNVTKAQFGQSPPVCQAFGLPDNVAHTISVNISVPPREQPQYTSGPLSGFAFDYMLIQPPSSVSPWHNENQDILLQILDGELAVRTTQTTFGFEFGLNDSEEEKFATASGGWDFDPENGFKTMTPGSQFNLTFIGTSVWWYGYFQDEVSLNTSYHPPSATFSIDGGGGEPLNITADATGTLSQALLFRTPVLPYGSHLLTVVAQGGDNISLFLNLTLQSLIIQKSTPLVSSSTIEPLPPTIIPKPSAPSAMNKRGTPGGIAGGIVGGVLFLLLMATGVCVFIWRAKRRQRSVQTRKNGPTVVPEPFPVPNEETFGLLAPRKAQLNQQNISNPFMEQELQAPPLTKWTRRHINSGSPESMPNSSESVTSIQDPEPPRPLLNDTFVRSGDETPPANTGPINGLLAVQVGGTSHRTVPDVTVSTTLPTEQLEREEDSGLRMAYVPILPPLYTTH